MEKQCHIKTGIKEATTKDARSKNIAFIFAATVATSALAGIGIAYGVNSENAANRLNFIKETQLLQEKGLIGDHPLMDLRELPGFDLNEQIKGGLLSIEGLIDGKTTQYIEFAWKTKEDDPRIIISKVPVENVQFMVIKDDPNANPTKSTVLFTGMKPEEFVKKSTLLSSRKSFLSSDNPNDYIERISDQLTIITMSQSSWDSFRGTINTGSQAK
jgi:hypothetical protein